MLLRRIKRLEGAFATRVGPGGREDDRDGPIDVDVFFGQLSLICGGYAGPAVDGLTLEQLHALAVDDEQFANAHLTSPTGSWLDDGTFGQHGAKRAAMAARELAVRILERDGYVDVQRARELRSNAREHYHSIDGHDVVALAPLPVPAYDFEATLAMARARFPREVALEPEVRLRRLEDAHARELADRSTRNAKLLDAPFDAVADRMHQLHVDELKRLMLAPRG
ncbi:MAG: hypothetical protein IT516_17275 [Burkholderiales bacterium]|nr:hypothetical protein [Burkholderiales bacterium]